MKRKPSIPYCILLLLILVMATVAYGCGKETEDPEPKATPTAVPTAKQPTPEPTATPTEEAEPTPTNTPTPEPNKRPEVTYGKWNSLNSVYELAYDIGEKHGVKIYAADLLPNEVIKQLGGRTFADKQPVLAELEQLDSILDIFPKDFFRQMISDVPIEIPFSFYLGMDSDKIRGIDFVAVLDGPQDSPDSELLGIGIYINSPETGTHEYLPSNTYFAIATAYQDYCYSMSTWGKTQLFDEDIWMSLQPEGFHYVGDNNLTEATMAQYIDYFQYPRQCYGSWDDRNVILCILFEFTYTNESMKLPAPTLKKMGYLVDCLRDSLATEDWPAETKWEAEYKRLCKIAGVEPGWK
ncbi:MAG: hypothetical protein IK055_08460 [Lachnospiraceae bacterium]|nr:hypothetical protein [Lachnospiraceae bacterium]